MMIEFERNKVDQNQENLVSISDGSSYRFIRSLIRSVKLTSSGCLN